jgi:hypothetical protein
LLDNTSLPLEFLFFKEVIVHLICASVIGILIILGKPSGNDFLSERMAD